MRNVRQIYSKNMRHWVGDGFWVEPLFSHMGMDKHTVLVKLRRTLLSENFHTPMGSSHCWLYAAV